jgi:methionyl-tRNA formyltransferase
MTPWRVVVVTRILPVALGFHATLREAGHEPVALLSTRDGPAFELGAQLQQVPAELDVLIPAKRSQLAPLLASVRPDLVVCMGFPWKIPADALAVPRHGWLNGHPSLLPRHRGPTPVAWTIRKGEDELGVTFHRMDAELDTGPILAQRSMPLGDLVEPDELYGRMGQTVMETFAEALAKIAAGEQGEAQPEGGEYESFFGDDDAVLDPSRPAAELHRLVWAWRYAIPGGRLRGALVDVDGEQVRVLASSLVEVEGARRLECGDGPLWLVRTEPAQEPTPAPAST